MKKINCFPTQEKSGRPEISRRANIGKDSGLRDDNPLWK